MKAPGYRGVELSEVSHTMPQECPLHPLQRLPLETHDGQCEHNQHLFLHDVRRFQKSYQFDGLPQE